MSISKISNVHYVPSVISERESKKENANHLNKQNLEPLTYLVDDHANRDGENFFNSIGKEVGKRGSFELLRTQQDEQMENLAADHASKYLSSGEIQSLGSYVKNYSRITTAADLLLNRLGKEGDQSVEIIINFLKAGKLTIAESYIILNYMYQKLQHKSTLKNILSSLIVKLEQQESAFLYLFDFFAVSKNPLLQNHPEILESVVRLNTGQITLDSLKEAIQYIREKNLDVEQLVSGYVKYHLKIIEQLQKAVSSFEERAMIAQFIGMERKIIMVHSIFLKTKDFIKQFFSRASGGEKLNYSSLLLAILNFAEVAEINQLAVKTLLKNFPAGKRDGQVGFLNHIMHLYDLFPQEVFSSDKARQSFFAGIRSYIHQHDPLQQKLLNHKPFDYFRNSR